MQTANADKMNTSERVFKIKPMEGAKSADSGLLDKKLFTGETTLHAKMDEETCLWHVQYSQGVVPQTLKQQFTSFPKLRTFMENYFKKRNVEITEIENA